MLRVLLVTQYYAEHVGGLQIVADQVARRLAARDVEVTWASSDVKVGGPIPGVKRLLMTCWNGLEQKWEITYPLWGPVSLLRLAGAVRRCDLVHLHDTLYMGNFVAFVCARLFRKPVVVTQHVDLLPYSSPLARGLMSMANNTVGRFVLGGCSACVVYSDKVRRYFTSRVSFRTPPVWISNGLETSAFRPLGEAERRAVRLTLGVPDGVPLLLFVGRFVERKGLPLLRELAGKFPDCRWIFIGRGEDDPGRWGMPQVQCLGTLTQEELVPYYQAADLLVLPSVGEGFPLVVQEAMSCGTPVLISEETASCLPGIEDVAFVSNLRGEDTRALLAELVASPTLLERRRDLTTEFARRQWADWDRCADQYRQLFEQVLGREEERKGSNRTQAGGRRRPREAPVEQGAVAPAG
jgi:glycosyltransferase involved in cell wall biosynthesis